MKWFLFLIFTGVVTSDVINKDSILAAVSELLLIEFPNSILPKDQL